MGDANVVRDVSSVSLLGVRARREDQAGHIRSAVFPLEAPLGPCVR